MSNSLQFSIRRNLEFNGLVRHAKVMRRVSRRNNEQNSRQNSRSYDAFRFDIVSGVEPIRIYPVDFHAPLSSWQV